MGLSQAAREANGTGFGAAVASEWFARLVACWYALAMDGAGPKKRKQEGQGRRLARPRESLSRAASGRLERVRIYTQVGSRMGNTKCGSSSSSSSHPPGKQRVWGAFSLGRWAGQEVVTLIFRTPLSLSLGSSLLCFLLCLVDSRLALRDAAGRGGEGQTGSVDESWKRA